MIDSKKAIKITFCPKKATTCPLCKEEFFREELLTGRGRLIAGELNKELRRSYEKSQRFGLIYPLIYCVLVCPNCFYASFPDDFQAPKQTIKNYLLENKEKRVSQIKALFPGIDFCDPRGLEHGIASYILGESCYKFFEKYNAPTMKRALCALRCSWTLNDWLKVHYEKSDIQEKMLKLQELFYKKASQYYQAAVEGIQKGSEIMDGIKHYGPDVDKNFGYEGMLYMTSFLTLKYHHKLDNNIQANIEVLSHCKRIVSRLFGSGKASRQKPSVLLDMARDLYKTIDTQLKELEKQLE